MLFNRHCLTNRPLATLCLLAAMTVVSSAAQRQLPIAPQHGATAAAPQELFSAAGGQVSEKESSDPTIIRSRRVRVDFDLLSNIRPAQRVVFNLFEDASFVAVFERAKNHHAWVGHIDGKAHSTFTLVVKQGALAATIRVPGKGVYRIRSLGDGLGVIQEIDEAKFPPCGIGPEHGVVGGGGVGGGPNCDDGSVIDVLVVYTPLAHSAAGDIEAVIDLAVLNANVAYDNSLIGTQLNLVHAQEIAYDEVGTYWDHLDRLTDPADGFMDAVHFLRDQYGADMVALVVDDDEFCGLAWIMLDLSPDFEQYAFSVTTWDCPALVFAHELGHNQGCCHVPGDGGGCDPDGGLFPYSNGHRFFGNSGIEWRTVMAYWPGTRIVHFSNPDVSYDGQPTGVPPGAPSEAHNALTINQTAYTIANFRCGTGGGNCLVLGELIWRDPGGDGDGIAECGEQHIELEVCLYSNCDVELVEAVLSVDPALIDIYEPDADYGKIPEGETNCGDNDFDMDLLFTTPTTVWFDLRVEYQQSGLPYYQHFTIPWHFPCDCELEPHFEICQIVFEENPNSNDTCYVDGIVQSGEQAKIRLQIRNNGTALAKGVQVSLTPVPEFVYFQGGDRGYPDLPPGGSCEWPNNPNNGWTILVQPDLAGTFFSDVIIEYENSACSPQVITGGVEIYVQPAPWIQVSPHEHDFGVVAPGVDVVVPVTVSNYGSAKLNVSGIDLSHPDHMSFNSSDLPGTVQPGAFATGEVVIDTTNLSGPIDPHTATFVSNACRGDPVPDERKDHVSITGFVGEAEAVHIIPTPTSVGSPDVSGNIIVYSNHPFVYWDVFAYDLLTNKELQITDEAADQYSSHISGSLVAWTDYRNGQPDIYAYDLATGCEFVVSDDPANEHLFGVDGNYIAFRRQYYTIPAGECPDPGGGIGLGPYNLFVYRYDGGCPPAGEICQVTFYPGNDQHQPMQEVDSSGDFGGGTLFWQEDTWTWSGSCWGQSASGQQKIEIAGTNPCAATIVELPCVQTVGTNSHADSERVAYHGDFPGFDDDQIGLWQNGDCQRITSDPDKSNEDPAIGANLIAYWKQSTGLFYWDLTTSTEHLISTNFPPYPSPPRRMDANVLVWTTASDVYYSFLKEADISVTSAGITLPEESPYVGESFKVTVAVTNLAPWDTTDNITVCLYDGDPDADNDGEVDPDAILLGCEVIPGMPGQSQVVVKFPAIVIDSAGPHDIYARVFVPSGDNPANNMAFKTLDVLAPGACCFQDGNCDEATTPDQCADASGVYWGDGSLCSDAPCPDTLGACCLPDDTCYDGLKAQECAAMGGNYHGDGSDCVDVQCPKCPWDLNGDGNVNILDLLMLLAKWGLCPGCPSDFDGDGNVGILDLLTLLANWGECP